VFAPLDILRQTKNGSGLYEGIFGFQVDLSSVQSNFKWRIRGNKANDFKLSQLVMEAF
jgi:hypothetical protein